MSATEHEPIVVVKKAWEEEASKQELVNYVPAADGGHEKKVVNFVPIDDGTRGIEHFMMYTFKQFMRHAAEAHLDHQDLFTNFVKVLSGSTLAYWENIIDHEPGYAPDEQTRENFQEAVQKLRNKICGYDDMGETQMYWLAHRIKKPAKMSPRDFHNRFNEILNCSVLLDGNYQEPTEHDRKTWFFKAFPVTYRKKFQEAAMKVENKSIEELTSYFQTLHDYEVKYGEFKELQTKRKREDEDDSSQRRTSNKRQRGRDRRSRKFNREGGRPNQDGDKGRRLKFSDACPNHPHLSHSWGECYGNPDSPNYRPPRFGNNSSRLDNSRRGGSNERSSGGKDTRNGKRSRDGRQDKSDVHHYEGRSSSRSSSNKSARKRSRSHHRSSFSEEESVTSNHYVGSVDAQVASSLFDENE